MINTEIHIIRAVLHQLSYAGRVALPSLGELSTVPSSPPATETVISAPRRTMVFHAKDVPSTDLVPFFVDHLGYQEDIAQGDIAQYFADVKTRLADGPVEWHGLGTFIAGSTGVQFQPADQWINYLNPGFEDIKTPPKDDKAAAIAASAASAGATASSRSIKEPATSTNYMPWVWLALGLVSFIIAMFLVVRSVNAKSAERAAAVEEQQTSSRSLIITRDDTLSKYAHQVNHLEPASADHQKSTIELREQEDESTSSESVSRFPLSTETTDAAVSAEQAGSREPRVATSESRCVQVMGAFSSADNASRMQRKLNKYGDNVYMKRHGSLYRVGVIGPCDEASSLQRELQSAYDIKPWGFALK